MMEGGTWTVTIIVGALAFGAWKILSVLLPWVKQFRLLKKLPTHPDTHWLKGNIDQLLTPMDYFKLSGDLIRERNVKILAVRFGPISACAIVHPDLLKQVINKHIEKPTGLGPGYDLLKPWLGDGLIISRGHKWFRNRRLLTPAFHFDILKGYIEVTNGTAETFLGQLAENAKTGMSLEVFSFVFKQTLDAMLRCALSYNGDIQTDKAHPYLVAVNELSDLVADRFFNPLLYSHMVYMITPSGRRCMKLCDRVHQFTGDIIRERKQALGQSADVLREKRRLDFLDMLLTAKDSEGQGLTDQEIQDEVDTFTFAGHDTTGSAISWSIHALAKYPDFQEKVYDDVMRVLGNSNVVTLENLSQFLYMNNFIKETLRYYCPVPIVSRELSEDVVLDGYQIPKGTEMDIDIYSMHHNPAVWTEPFEFRPDRFDDTKDIDPYGFIPFSAGSRNCIGQNFAMNEIKIVLAKFVQRYKVRLDPDHEVELMADLVMRSKNGIHVIVEERQS